MVLEAVEREEKMKIMKIIVREILWLFPIIILGYIIAKLGDHLVISNGCSRGKVVFDEIPRCKVPLMIHAIGYYSAFYGYPVCLFLRFIISAVRKLKE
jgi:hypothetical protein